VRQGKTIHADHHRQKGLLGNFEGLNVQISRLLVVLGMELNPPRISDRHGILLIIPDAQWRRYGPVGAG